MKHTDGGANVEVVFEVDNDGIALVHLHKRAGELSVYDSQSTGKSIRCCSKDMSA